MTYVCSLCGNELVPHGTAGLTCMYGHHFLKADVEGKAATVHRVRAREVRVPAWAPGAVLGGLALAVEVVRVVVEAVS